MATVGALIVELRANAAQFRAQMEEAHTGLERVRGGADRFGEQLSHATRAVRAMGEAVVIQLNPALGGAVSQFTFATRTAATLPVALGAITLAVAAASISLGLFIKRLEEAQQFQVKLNLAARGADLGGLRALMSAQSEQLEQTRLLQVYA